MEKNYKKVTKLTNAIDPATTTAKNWGFAPVPGKGGNTNNYGSQDWKSKREVESGDGDN